MSQPGLQSPRRWYADLSRYQWLVLAIASAGWVFDTFEGQLFNITRGSMLGELIGASAGSEKTALDAAVKQAGDVLLGVFLLGGTLGGVVFGSLADRFGRKPTMAATILCYSIFSGLTYFATEVWQVAALRFLVALGVGGEWAVAAALVAEVFPAHARAHAAGIFHATSIFGTWLAAIAGLAVNTQWRYAYLIGIAPALLVLWVRSGIDEPQSWKQAGRDQRAMGSFRELFGVARWARRAILGLLLAAVGLGTFWGVTVAGQDLMQELLVRGGMSSAEATSKARFAYGIVQTTGGGLGLLCFAPLAQRFGRRPAFAIMLVAAQAIVPITCYWPQTYGQMLAILPVFGFLTLSIHAGYAIYFPELFPSHLRATGAGFCFNGGRLLAAPILFLSGRIKALPGLDLRSAVCFLSLLFSLGLVVLWFLPETKDQPLPD
ncbi:MAG TPA: MFS transporter [Pirellulales bacterium]|nr:MFS transporter [Pirellulales bacterium]